MSTGETAFETFDLESDAALTVSTAGEASEGPLDRYLTEIGRYKLFATELGLTRERVRQIELGTLRSLSASGVLRELREAA